MAPRPSSAQFQSTAGWLDSIRVQDSRNWFFDLSSRFQPDVPEYGVILPSKAENASLCLEPKQGDPIAAQHQIDLRLASACATCRAT